MKIRNLCMVGVLAAALSLNAAAIAPAAEETSPADESTQSVSDLLKGLFGEGGALSDVVPEGTDTDALINSVSEQLDEAGVDLNQAIGEVGDAIGQLSDAAQTLSDNIDTESLFMMGKQYLSQYLDQDGDGELDIDLESLSNLESLGDVEGLSDLVALFGGEADGLAELNDIMAIYDKLKDEEEDYILDYYEDELEPGDEQVVLNSIIYMDDYDLDTPVIRNMAVMEETNYTVNEDDELELLCSAKNVVLFTHEKDEDGNYPITSAEFSEDGENYGPSIEKMCEEVGISIDDAYSMIQAADYMTPYEMVQYLNEHPEYTGIEYQGEIRTVDELEELSNAAIGEMAAEFETESVE